MAEPHRFDAEYFQKVYRNYESQNPPAKLAFYRRLVSTQMHGRTVPRILDLGCASGLFLAGLDVRWHRFGIDLSQYAIGRASDAMPDAHLAVATCTDVPFCGPFDAIVAFDVIEHVAELDRVAQSVASLLANDGAFIFVVPVYDGPFGPLVHILDRDPTHIHKRDRTFWLSWTDRHFSLVDWTGLFRYLPPVGPYLHWPTRTFRRFSSAIAVVARKRR